MTGTGHAHRSYVIDREKVSAILQKRFPAAHPRELAAALNAIVGLGTSTGAKVDHEEAVMMTLKNILVATDFSEASTTAQIYGRELARRFHATLHVLHVVEDVAGRFVSASGLPYDLSTLQAELEATAQNRLRETLPDDDPTEVPTQRAQMTAGSPSRAIVEYAADHAIDLIVVGTHGRGAVAHFFLGSVAERVVRTASCPVLTVHHPQREFVRPDALELAAKS
jgi:nucleotide-binding universal stress UspA family protein